MDDCLVSGSLGASYIVICCALFSPILSFYFIFFQKKKLLQKIGQCSIYYFCLEYLFTWISREIICRVFCLPQSWILRFFIPQLPGLGGKWAVQHHLIFWLAQVQLCWTLYLLLCSNFFYKVILIIYDNI